MLLLLLDNPCFFLFRFIYINRITEERKKVCFWYADDAKTKLKLVKIIVLNELDQNWN